MEVRAIGMFGTNQYIKKVISLICVICLFMLHYGKVYAMEPIEEWILEKQQFTNAEQYEMNIVLQELLIKCWNTAPWSMDEIESDFKVDPPLGKYSEEKLKEYTDENFRAEFDYCRGYTKTSYQNESGPDFVQVVRIYKDDEMYCMSYYFWETYVSAACGVVPICYFESYCMDIEDAIRRRESNEHYYD